MYKLCISYYGHLAAFACIGCIYFSGHQLDQHHLHLYLFYYKLLDLLLLSHNDLGVSGLGSVQELTA